ncbi:MAG: GAF domain-containing sensor histidine kinase [Chloroflexota bacterium]
MPNTKQTSLLPALDAENFTWDQLPIGIDYLVKLTLSSTLAELPTHDFQVPPGTMGLEIAHIFEERPEIPGVIVVEKGKVLGVFSRRKFFEQLGQFYGVAVYHRRPIGVMLKQVQTAPLVLAETMLIHQAAIVTLGRPMDQFYEPIVVRRSQESFALLDTHVLLLAQSSLLNKVFQREQKRREIAEAMQKIGQVLSSSLNVQKVTKQILKQLDKVLSYERGAVMLKRGNYLEAIAQRGFPDKEKGAGLRVLIRDDVKDLFNQIVATRQAVIIEDVAADPHWHQIEWLPLDHSWMGVPLISQDEVIGMISLTRKEIGTFEKDDITVAFAFASQVAIALENARLYGEIATFNAQLESKVEERTAELNQAYNTLEQLDKKKSDFVRISAHELRTPLTVIKGYTQVLGSSLKNQTDDGVENILNGIVAGVNRMLQIVNTLLDITKIDSGTLAVSKETVELHNVYTAVMETIQPSATDRKLEFSVSGLKDLSPVTGDPSLIAKVFNALLLNAIKYTPDGGKIAVKGRLVQANDQSWAEFAVQDTGIGIDPQYHLLIFEKFCQIGEVALHSSGQTKFKGGGPGLGLYIAKGIIEAHQGKIWVESVGCNETSLPGSTFIVRLPVAG